MDEPKTRQEKKGRKTKDIFNKKTVRLKEALLANRKISNQCITPDQGNLAVMSHNRPVHISLNAKNFR